MSTLSDSVIQQQSIDVLDSMHLSQQFLNPQLNASSQSLGILVMGLTGAGKSTFISQLTHQNAEVGHSLESCTTDIMPYEYWRSDGRPIYLIDTPGFDDTNTDYAGVFKKIASFLCTLCDVYGSGLTIGGMIYVHRITDVRMSRSSVKSLRIFEKICGEHCFQHVTVVTTMWDLVKSINAKDAATIREKTLMERPEFFGTLVGSGAMMERHYNEDSARHIVELLVKRQKNISLQLQLEMRGSAAMTLEATTAGKYLEGELESMRKRYETQKKELEESLNETIEEDDLRSEISEEIRDCNAAVSRLKADQGSLSVTLEDMQHEQVVWYTRRHNDLLQDRILEEQSMRMAYELKKKVHKLEKDRKRRVEKEIAQNERMEELEERNKWLEATQKELEDQQALRDRAKEKRSYQFDFIARMRVFLASSAKDLREPVPVARRADSMPLEAKGPKRPVVKPTRGRSQSRGHPNAKENIRYTGPLEEQVSQPLYTTQDVQPQHYQGYDHIYQHGYDAGGIENSGHTKHFSHRSLQKYTPTTPGFPGGQMHSLPGPVVVDPYGLKRNLPQSAGPLPRKYDN